MLSTNMFLLYGPSCSGQDSVAEGLAERLPVQRVITTTTRPMRPGESQGNPYYFLTKDEFEAALSRGEFVEHATHYSGHHYGATRKAVEEACADRTKIVILKTEWQGVEQLRKIFPEAKAIFVSVHDLDTLRRRMRQRDNATEEFIETRLAYIQKWLPRTDLYDHIIWNDDGKLHESIDDAERYIRAHSTLA